jgi:hypothetical protein
VPLCLARCRISIAIYIINILSLNGEHALCLPVHQDVRDLWLLSSPPDSAYTDKNIWELRCFST